MMKELAEKQFCSDFDVILEFIVVCNWDPIIAVLEIILIRSTCIRQYIYDFVNPLFISCIKFL